MTKIKPNNTANNDSLPTIKIVTCENSNYSGCNPDICMPDTTCSPDTDDCGPVWD